MMPLNTDLMHVLVEEKQRTLRQQQALQHLTAHETGRMRKAIGACLIGLGERVGGIERKPAQSPVPPKLAIQ